MRNLIWLVCFTAKLSAVTLLVTVLLGSPSAGASDEPQMVLNHRGVVKVNTLPVCTFTPPTPFPRYEVLPCMEPYREGSPILWWHPTANSLNGAWASKPAKPWRWAKGWERRRYDISEMEQVRTCDAYLCIRTRSGTDRRVLR